MSAEALQLAGSVAATAAAAVALLADRRRLRAAGLLAALAIALALVLGQAWDELSSVRDEPAKLALAAAAAGAGLAALAAAFIRLPWLLPLALVAALPFRVPVESGAQQANLLAPLYLVIGGGTLAYAAGALRGGHEPDGPAGVSLLPKALRGALAAAIVLYAAQAAYSEDVAFAARNVGFFLVPFAAMFLLLAEVDWTPRLLGAALAVFCGLGAVFALVGIAQHQAGAIFWNDALEMSNDFHFYFRVNSLFWDPNIYGRYVAMAIVLSVAVLLWTRDALRAAGITVLVAVLFAGLVFSFSQTSLFALIAGLAVLAALKWSWRWAAVGLVVVLAATFFSVRAVGGLSDSDRTQRGGGADVTSGHSTLIEGGAELFAERPLGGFGSASFPKAFAEAEDVPEGETTVSHNEPVTVAAEQGILGLFAYLAVLGTALWTLFAGLAAVAPGLRGAGVADPLEDRAAARPVARMAILAAFCALLLHTAGYAGYLTDPLTWALLAIGGALAARTGAGPAPRR